MNRGKIDEHGRVLYRQIVVRESVDGFHGPIGSSTIEDVTEKLEAVADLLDDDDRGKSERIGEARGRLRRILDKTRVEDNNGS